MEKNEAFFVCRGVWNVNRGGALLGVYVGHLSSLGGLRITEFFLISVLNSLAFFFALFLPRWMKKPRCGVPDHPHLGRSRRKKRYALTGQKWRQKHITYR